MTFRDKGTQDVFQGIDSRSARRSCPSSLLATAQRRLDILAGAQCLRDIASVPGNHLELLSGDRDGQYSIRINNKYRICFIWTDQGASGVELVDYH